MNKLKEKLYNYEQTPPAGAWEEIASSLDDAAMEFQFPHRLHQAEFQPPAGVWEKIAVDLAADVPTTNLSTRLYAMEVPPPVQTWSQIEQVLNNGNESTTPIRSLRHLWKYAAAAILIGAIAFGIIRTTLQTETSETAGIVTSDTDTRTGTSQQSMVMQAPIPAPEPRPAVETPRKMVAAVEHRKQSRKMVANAAVLREDRVDPSLTQSIYAYADHVPDIAERYVMLMTPDGNIIRMSKKLASLLCCVTGEDQDAGCKNQLKKWQEKMAASSLAPSPANFMDILGLVDALDESNDL